MASGLASASATDTLGAVVEVLFEPDDLSLDSLVAARPDTPFHMPGFIRARRAVGEVPIAFMVTMDGTVIDGCVGLLKSGYRHRGLKIHSAPALPLEHPIWPTIWHFAKRHGVDALQLDSFASPPLSLPELPGETGRRSRVEHVIDLQGWCTAQLSTNHRRNLARARKAGIEIVETADPAAIVEHEALIGQSFQRLRDRGGSIVMAGGSYSRTLVQGILASRAGSLFQAHAGGTVLSSVLLLQAPVAGYYFSAGSSPEGMKQGASQFLICSIAERLRDSGKSSFNLAGAAEDQPGLARFKLGFGASTITTEAAAFAPAKGLWPHIIGAVRLGLMQRGRSCT